MTEKELERLLAPTSTSAERVRGLLELVSPKALADMTHSSASTVRNWSVSDTEPRPAAAVVLDDLRMVALTLLGGLEPPRVASWLVSRDPSRFEGTRPLEMVGLDPMAVLAAAHETLLTVAEAREVEEREERTLELVPAGADDA